VALGFDDGHGDQLLLPRKGYQLVTLSARLPSASGRTIVVKLLIQVRGMTITTLSSREFNQDTSRAKKAAKNGPVFITDRGRPAHVLLTIEDYQRLSSDHVSIVEMLAMPATCPIDFEPPRLRGPIPRPADLS
jgi:prevent-host-death family protein